jgi:hypothetical protein
VGLGKTIEAGLILRELLMRQRVRRVVVVAPPSVVVQWREELEARFGLSFVIHDREFVVAKRRERGYSVNPWLTHNLFIISHALVRDEAYVAPLRALLKADGGGSLMILDEAHNAAPASGARYALDSKLTGAVRELAELFEHRLFLSATPHNGHSNSFTALLEVLDPQRFTRGIPLEEPQRQLEPVMVRRLKSDLREVKVEFPRREVHQVTIKDLPEGAPELVLSRMLEQYRSMRARRLERASRSTQAAAGLLDISLQKRLLSSIEALRCTLHTHRETLRKARAKKQKESPPPVTEEQLDLLREAPGADDERAGVSEEDLGREERAQVEAATRVSSEAAEAAELALLDRMIEVAEAHAGVPDRRIEHLVGWIRDNLCPDLPRRGVQPSKPARWLDRCKGREHAARLLIFTEYADTKRYLEQQLAAALAYTDRAEERVEVFHGEIASDERREAIKKAFIGDPAEHPADRSLQARKLRARRRQRQRIHAPGLGRPRLDSLFRCSADVFGQLTPLGGGLVVLRLVDRAGSGDAEVDVPVLDLPRGHDERDSLLIPARAVARVLRDAAQELGHTALQALVVRVDHHDEAEVLLVAPLSQPIDLLPEPLEDAGIVLTVLEAQRPQVQPLGEVPEEALLVLVLEEDDGAYLRMPHSSPRTASRAPSARRGAARRRSRARPRACGRLRAAPGGSRPRRRCSR